MKNKVFCIREYGLEGNALPARKFYLSGLKILCTKTPHRLRDTFKYAKHIKNS